MQQEVVLRAAQRLSLTPQLASFLTLLIDQDVVTPKLVLEKIGQSDLRSLCYRLKQRMPVLIIARQRNVGYWLPDDLRLTLATELGMQLPERTQRRMNRYRRLDEGVTEFLEQGSDPCLNCLPESATSRGR